MSKLKHDPVDIIAEFETFIEFGAERHPKSIPRALAQEVLALAKAVRRSGLLGAPVVRDKFDRMIDYAVAMRARTRFQELRAAGENREHALHHAAQYGARIDRRPQGEALTAAGVRDRLEHPGRYPSPARAARKVRPPRKARSPRRG
jgi:hypothetical protein